MPDIVSIDTATFRIEDSFVRFFLLIGTERALLIDSGATTADAAAIAASLTDRPLLLLNTHGDGDHTAGNGGFLEYFMHPADYAACRLSERFPAGVCRPLSDGQILDLGGRRLRIVAIPGHTAGSVAVLDESRRALYTGDTVQTEHIYMFGAHRAPDRLADSLKKLSALEGVEVLYPSHGQWHLPPDYIRRVAEDWRRVQTGALTPTPLSLHGREVLSYDGEACGFYCGTPE